MFLLQSSTNDNYSHFLHETKHLITFVEKWHVMLNYPQVVLSVCSHSLSLP